MKRPSLAMPSSRLLVLVVMIASCAPLSTAMYTPAMPFMALSLHASPAQVLNTMAFYFLGIAIGQLPFGALGDRFGRRPVLLGALITFSIVSLLCAAAGTIWLFLLGRFLQGICLSAILVGTMSIMRDSFQGKNLLWLMTLSSVSIASVSSATPFLGGLFVYAFGWRSIFMILAFYAFVAALLVLLWLPESNTDPLLSGLKVPVLLRNYWKILTRRRFLCSVLPLSFIFAARGLYLSLSPALLIGFLKLSPLTYGALTSSIIMTYVVGGLLSNKLISGPRAPASPYLLLWLAPLTCLCGGFLMLFMSSPSGLTWIVLPAMFVYLALGVVQPVGTSLALEPFPRIAGTASAVIGTLKFSMSALVGWLFHMVPGLTYSSRLLALFIIGLGCLAFFTSLFMKGKKVRQRIRYRRVQHSRKSSLHKG